MTDRTLIKNAKIYVSPSLEYNWMVIDGNIIEKLGTGPIEWEGNVVDLNGDLVLPGIHDSHIHVYSLGRMEYRLKLKGVGSIAELRTKLESYANNTSSSWIIGGGWDQDYMEDKRYPTREDIDDIVPDRPVLLYRGCNHIGLVNSKALEIMGINTDTKNPDGGKIDLDENGPTGILRENALDLVNEFIKPLEEKNKLEYFKTGLKSCLQAGITAVHTNDSDAWKYYSQLADSNNLPIRVYLTIPYSEIDDEGTPAFGERNGLLECRRVKLFADGSLGAETAALREPYAGSENRGILIQPKEELFEKIKYAHSKGYQLEVHAIGDLAAELVIEGFIKAGIDEKDRGIITHCQVLGKDLIDLMCSHGYIANIQPPFVPTDAYWAEKRLGNLDRINYSYAWKKLNNGGVLMAGGSDAPIEIPDPFYGMYCAIKRPGPDGNTWKEEECLTFSDALELYTHGGAYAVGKEKKLGQLKSGMYADFVVVSPSILTNLELLTEYPVKQVWVDGVRKYYSSS